MGDVLICGPAVRAVAAVADRTSMLVSPLGASAAALLPGVDDIIVWECPWITAGALTVDAAAIDSLIARIRASGVDEALILTSFHQAALPTALVLRLAGIPRIAAISEDYPGGLLDRRLAPPPDAPEPERMLALARAAGFGLPPGDDGRLKLTLAPSSAPLPAQSYLVLHPGVSAPARAYPEAQWRQVVSLLTAIGWTVALTGSKDESELTARLAQATCAPGTAKDLGGTLDLNDLAALLKRSRGVVVANTGPAHLAAAVGAPVVSLFAPVVPSSRWAPYGTRSRILGDQQASCRGSRARECPVAGHPCLSSVTAADVVAAVQDLVGSP
jgi:ADP-heptose:LPS heptosyltransferase